MADMTYHHHADQLLDKLPLSPTMPCSYFEEKLSSFREFRLESDLDPLWLEIILAKGYRRCGDIYYQTGCPGCQLCQSYRICVGDFRPRRSQSRVLRRNQDVKMELVTPCPTSEKEAIYLRYQRLQHHEKLKQLNVKNVRITGYNQDQLLGTMHYQMYTNPHLTRELELRLDGRLIGFGTVDVALFSASAVYFVFDPEYAKRSLGTLAILRALQWATERKMRYYYLGYYIDGHPKMSYKQQYQPAEILTAPNGPWTPFSTDDNA